MCLANAFSRDHTEKILCDDMRVVCWEVKVGGDPVLESGSVVFLHAPGCLCSVLFHLSPRSGLSNGSDNAVSHHWFYDGSQIHKTALPLCTQWWDCPQSRGSSLPGCLALCSAQMVQDRAKPPRTRCCWSVPNFSERAFFGLISCHSSKARCCFTHLWSG